jgi:hypothetical protein
VLSERLYGLGGATKLHDAALFANSRLPGPVTCKLEHKSVLSQASGCQRLRQVTGSVLHCA